MDPCYYAEHRKHEDGHWWFAGRRRIIMALLERELGPGGAPDRRLLDIGCGTGMMLGELSRLGAAEGVDADEQAVAFCRARGLERVSLLEGDRLPQATGTYDVVSLFDVVEHLDDDLAMLREARRVLAPGGLLAVTVPAYAWMWGPQDEISHHRRRYVRPQLRALLEQAGLAVRRATYFNTLLLPPIAAVRVLRRDRPGDELRSDFEMTRPGPLNTALARLFGAEAALLRAGVSFPFGVSILALARPAG